MQKTQILWADDEIDLLKPHILFLESKGYEIEPVNNGADAIDLCKDRYFDLVFLDEQMPGVSGLEALDAIKIAKPSLPVVMITKSEEEYIMEEAIGSKIADYLIKPVNPKQILLAIKKIIDSKRLVSEKTTSGYGREFGKISMELNNNYNAADWAKSYDELVNWEIRLQESQDESMKDVFSSQKAEANGQFARFITDNYLDWLNDSDEETPLMAHTVLQKKLIPNLTPNSSKSTFLIVIDNLRLDQYKIIEPFILEFYRKESQENFYSILPTSTEFARNALFAGMMPSEIKRKYRKQWEEDNSDEGSKNQNEAFYLDEQLKRFGKPVKTSYTKITSINYAKNVVDNIFNLMQNDLNVIVYNFVDMLSHARTEMKVIKELAEDEAAYRSLTKSWFQNSPLFEIIKKIAEKNIRLVITTDHGSIRVKEPVKIIGDRNTTTNLRYKEGKNLAHDDKNLFVVNDPEDAFLPKPYVSSTYVFTTTEQFFVYPNNYHQYVHLYRDTFQHGGISMEEMIIPYVVFDSK